MLKRTNAQVLMKQRSQMTGTDPGSGSDISGTQIFSRVLFKETYRCADRCRQSMIGNAAGIQCREALKHGKEQGRDSSGNSITCQVLSTHLWKPSGQWIIKADIDKSGRARETPTATAKHHKPRPRSGLILLIMRTALWK